MPTLPPLLRASHPGPTVAVTAVATALSASAGLGARSVAVAAAFLSGQLSVGWSNDWVDAARDRAVDRRDKPVVQGALRVTTVRTAALLALLACVPLSLLVGTWAGAAHLVAVASAWQYNAHLKSTALSWAPYAVSFGLVPSIAVLGLPGHPLAPAWATAGGALLGVGAHLANVLPDLADDAATGVRGLPHRLGHRRSALLAGVALVGATALLALGPGYDGRGALAVLVAGGVFAAGLRRGTAFGAAIVVALLDVGLLVIRGGSLV